MDAVTDFPKNRKAGRSSGCFARPFHARPEALLGRAFMMHFALLFSGENQGISRSWGIMDSS